MRTVTLLLTALVATAASAADYVVLDGVGDRTEYRPVVERLEKLHDATVVPFDPDDLTPLLATLQRHRPACVALVMAPEDVELDFQRRFLQMASEVDEDPFVDFAYGYVTGATGADALALVEAGQKAHRQPRPFRHGVLCGGGESSHSRKDAYPLRTAVLPTVRGVVKGEGTEHDRAFVKAFLPELDGCGIVEFVGHGMPSYVSGGPDWKDLAGLDLDAAVVLSVPCFTGVTHVWYQDDRSAGVLRRKTIPLEESFALRVIAAGPSGYTAYLCGRPAGPELYTDLVRIAVEGMTLGEARRRDYDKTVLGFLGFGDERMVLPRRQDGQKIPSSRDSVRDIMVEGAAGGILYGDPAVRPFRPRKDQDPVHVRHEKADGGLAIRLGCRRTHFWSQCGDQTARFGGGMALRAYARVPLADLAVGDVVVDSCRLGSRDAGSRLIWAVEDDRGERWLHVKLMFSRKEAQGAGDLSARLLVTPADGEGKTRGGQIEKPQRRSRGGGGAHRRDLAATEVDPALEEAACRFEAKKGALEAALIATAATIGKGDVPPQKALADLENHGRDGFRAVCSLLLVGHHHYRTWELLRVTYRPGEEKHLLELAEETLPGYGTWSALEGLGVTKSKQARTYLLDRLAKEENSGLFMSAAQGLAHLGEKKAVPIVAEKLLSFERGWSGVERHLVTVLFRIGGKEARRALERYAKDERAKHADMARRFLEQMK